jgi:hypothetical protein
MNLGMIVGILAGVFSFSAYLLYIVAILKGYTKPSRASWFIWGAVGIILVLSYRASGAENTIWVPVSEAIAPVVIAILSIKYGSGGTEKIDIFAFVGSLFSLFLWWYFDSPVVALVTNLMLDFFAALPTIEKSWKNPAEEDRFAWTLTQIGNSLNLFAIDKLLFGVIIYPIYTFIIDGVITALLYRPLIEAASKKIYVRESDIHGRGIFAARNVKAGEVVCIIRGRKMFKVNQDEKDALDNPDWIGIELNAWIDPVPPYKYLNHSCDPTTIIKDKRFLIALRDIKKDEEITIDYSLTEIDLRWSMSCSCSAKNCRKIAKAIQELSEDVYNSYLPNIPKDFQLAYNEHMSKMKNGK